MPFTAAALAIDGARTPASLQRLGNRAAVKQSGVINVGDLKVIPLAAPGAGVRISAGGGVIENRYVSNSGQAYIVENQAAMDLTNASVDLPGGFPATNPGVAQSHLVCVTVGDPLYTTAGHAWLTDANKPATPTAALTYQYVRPFIIRNVPAGTTRVEDLPSPPPYPCYALSRLDLASNWTTITGGAQIVDLRRVVNPRENIREWNAVASNDTLSTANQVTFEYFPDNSNSNIAIPDWATVVYIDAWLQGMKDTASDDTNATFRVWCQTGGWGTGGFKYSQQVAGRYPVLMAERVIVPAAQRGTAQAFQIQAVPTDAASQGDLVVDGNSNYHIRLRFVEEAS